MTLPPFELHRPETIEEASALLEEHGDEAVLKCGGTELILLMKLGFADYRHVVDIRGIDELRGSQAANGALHLGAATTHRQIERSPLVRERLPALARMEQRVANVRVRSAGTIGGNLCFSDPHSDPATFLLAVGAELILRRGKEQSRTIAMADFIRGPFETALEPGEILVSIVVPALPPGAGIAHGKFSFRERPAATVTCMVRVQDEQVTEARVSVGSVGAVPVRCTEAENLLADHPPANAAIEAAGIAAGEASGALEDLNGSPEYKRNLVRVLVRRTFLDALQQATLHKSRA